MSEACRMRFCGTEVELAGWTDTPPALFFAYGSVDGLEAEIGL